MIPEPPTAVPPGEPPLESRLARAAGSALTWRTAQLLSTKVIFLARTLVLARLLLPEDFGLLAISLIAVDLLVVLTEIGMVPALVQQREPEESHYHAAWTAGMVRALLVTLVVALAAPLIAALFEEPRATNLIRVAAVRPLLEAAASIRLAELTRRLDFRAMALVRLPDALVNTLLSIALAPWLGVWALIVGTLAGPLAHLFMSYRLAPYRPRLVLDWRSIRPLLRFGRWIFLVGVISTAGRSLMQMIISRQLGPAELGLYFLAAKLAFIPSEISAEVINSVAFPLYAGMQDDRPQMSRAYRLVLNGMVTLLVPITVLMIALAPALVTYVLGPRWEGTASLIGVLALVNIVGLLGETLVPIWQGAGQPYRAAVIETIQSTIMILSLPLLIARFGTLGAALAWLPAIGASQLLSLAYARHVLTRPFAGLAWPLAATGVIALLGGLLAATISAVLPGFAGLLLAAGMSSISVAGLLWLAERRWRLGLLDALVQAFPEVGAWIRPAPAEPT